MHFDILTIFPEAFESYFQTSIIKRAQAKKLIQINLWDLRKWTKDPHQTVDDHPYGGGAGMIFMVKPIAQALKDLTKSRKKEKTRIILFSVKGKKLTQNKLEQLKKFEHLILICPHYEGVDERVSRYLVDEEISIGDYILTGGELPAMVLVDGITRLIPGVIRADSLKEESFSRSLFKSLKLKIKNLYYEYPQYTRPEIFYPNTKNKKIRWQVPKILLSGNHQKIKEWRESHLKSTSSS
ncbi:MAG: tRNA (guanosine(37)-N1)-methyltransferase TrmD [Minisyncoccia bacterium]